MTPNQCPVCYTPTDRLREEFDRGVAHVGCRVCGEFSITEEASEDLDHLTRQRADVHLLSAAIRRHFIAGDRPLVTTTNVRALIDSVRRAANPINAIDDIVLYVYERASSAADYVPLDSAYDYPIVAATGPAEFAYYIQQAQALGLLENAGDRVRLTLDGWRHVQELRSTRARSNQAFVAMWFAPEMRPAWEGGFRLALSDTGFDPVRIDLLEHNEKIDDRIISEIRRSGLLVADFTGDRGGVYFEAGFAMGLGIPVIWTVKDTDVAGLHFDTRQYNHIVWAEPADLRQKLRLRIEASIPGRAGIRPA